MPIYSYIKTVNKYEYINKYKRINKSIFIKALDTINKNSISNIIPCYTSGKVIDMGASNLDIKAVIINVPDIDTSKSKRIQSAIKRTINYGASVAILDNVYSIKNNYNIEISNGEYLSPYMMIKSAKIIAPLLGMDFLHSHIFVASASNEEGKAVSRILFNEALYLTLCTENKDKTIEWINKLGLYNGICPGIVSNYKKAIIDCDILFYTGGIVLDELLSLIQKKILIVNLTGLKIDSNKFLIIDDAILRAEKYPVIYGDVNIEEMLTIKSWEGAIMSTNKNISSMDNIKKSEYIYKILKGNNINIDTVLYKGKKIEADYIYKYR